MIPSFLGWMAWVTVTMITLQNDQKTQIKDEFTGAMFIELQDALNRKNPNVDWLDASEIRAIQRNNTP